MAEGTMRHAWEVSCLLSPARVQVNTCAPGAGCGTPMEQAQKGSMASRVPTNAYELRKYLELGDQL